MRLFTKMYRVARFAPTSPFTGLTREETLELEVECLKRLGKYKHFPKYIKHTKDSITMENMGTPLDGLNRNVVIKDVDKQVSDMIELMEKENVIHLDILTDEGTHASWNICVRNGVLSLVDFDQAIIDRKTPTEELRVKYEDFINNEGYEGLKRKIITVISNHKHIKQ